MEAAVAMMMRAYSAGLLVTTVNPMKAGMTNALDPRV